MKMEMEMEILGPGTKVWEDPKSAGGETKLTLVSADSDYPQPQPSELIQIFALGKNPDHYFPPETLALELLYQHLADALSSTPDSRRRADSILSRASLTEPRFALALLQVIAASDSYFTSTDSSWNFVDERIQRAAAVLLKNYLRSTSSSSIPIFERRILKTLIFCVAVSFLSTDSATTIRSHLRECLAAICNNPHHRGETEPSWHQPLLELLWDPLNASLHSASIEVIIGTVGTIVSKFQQACSCWLDSGLFMDIYHCLNNLVQPIAEIFFQVTTSIDSLLLFPSSSPSVLRSLFESQRLCYAILSSSLTIGCLPFFFARWMDIFLRESQKYQLSSPNHPPPPPSVVSEEVHFGGEERLSSVDELRTTLCEHMRVYYKNAGIVTAEKIVALCGHLINLLDAATADRLVFAALRSLLCMLYHFRLYRCDLYKHQQLCRRLLEKVIVPIVQLQNEEEELFEADPDEFIRKITDPTSKRGIALELLQCMAAVCFEREVTAMVSTVINKMLNSFSANPVTNWRKKDCALRLVGLLAKLSRTKKSELKNVLDLENLFKSVIIPELQSHDLNEFPVLKAEALKLLTMLHSHLPKSDLLVLIPQVSRFLVSNSSVVRSYATACIEELSSATSPWLTIGRCPLINDTRI